MGAQLADLQQIINRTIAARRVVAEGDGAVELVRLSRVQDLPDPVHAVDHGVVQVEGRVVERGEDVGAIAAHGIVAGAVQAEGSVGALELVLEVADAGRGGTDGDVEQVLGGEGRGRGGHGQIAALAARVEHLDVAVDGQVALHGGLLGAEVDLEVLEGPGLHAAAARAGGKPDASGADDAAVVGEVLAVPAHAGVAAIEDGRLVQIGLVLEPVPVLCSGTRQRLCLSQTPVQL